MKDFKEYKEKYSKRQDSAGRWKYPAGGKDILDLCLIIDNLLILVRKLQSRLPTDQQNEVERDLLVIEYMREKANGKYETLR